MIRSAFGVSLLLHAMVLAAVAPPRTQPRYVVLEARLEVRQPSGRSDYLTSSPFTFPLAPISLSPGPHSVVLRNSELGATRSMSVTIKPGKPTSLRVDLRRSE